MKLLIIAFVLLSVPVHAQTIFRMDYGEPAVPSGGWPGTVAPSAPTHTVSRVAGAGPSGQDVYDMAQRYTGSAVIGYGGEFYWGWNGNIEPSDPPQGARRFYRWRMRFSPDTNFRGLYWQDGSPTPLGNKLLMVGDGCGRNSCRVIVGYRGAGTTNTATMNVVIDGGTSPTPSVPIRVGEWMDVQVEADSSSTTSSGDGAFKLWINNNDYTQPTAQITGIQLNPVRWRYVSLGAYNNSGLAEDGVHTWRHADFEASADFSASWHGSVAPPPTPVDCVVSTWSFASATAWSACVDGTQTRSETWTRTVITPAANGGASCPALAELRTASQPCSVAPPAVWQCEVRATPTSYADGDIKRTIRCDTNGPANLPVGTMFTIPRQ